MTQPLAFAFKPRAVQSPAEELANLWQRARLAVENAPACPCHGIVAGRMDADAMETNVLSALRNRYRAMNDEAGTVLSALIEKRLRKSPFAGLRQPFDQWLRGLTDVSLAPISRDVLIGDLRSVLAYHAETQPQFACE